ncbi:MAG: hypothetical protein IJH34_17900, partial [Romboutsia sp.]|nr:hypothetical protein [Romboutsia sp.]
SRKISIFINKSSIYDLFYHPYSIFIKTKKIEEGVKQLYIDNKTIKYIDKVMHALNVCIESTIFKHEYG